MKSVSKADATGIPPESSIARAVEVFIIVLTATHATSSQPQFDAAVKVG